jgi:hypothetical protein
MRGDREHATAHGAFPVPQAGLDAEERRSTLEPGGKALTSHPYAGTLSAITVLLAATAGGCARRRVCLHFAAGPGRPDHDGGSRKPRPSTSEVTARNHRHGPATSRSSPRPYARPCMRRCPRPLDRLVVHIPRRLLRPSPFPGEDGLGWVGVDPPPFRRSAPCAWSLARTGGAGCAALGPATPIARSHTPRTVVINQRARRRPLTTPEALFRPDECM